MSGNGHRTFRYSVPITFIKRCKKIQRTRKNTISCARQGLKHLRSYSPQVHCNGCTEQQPMMTAGKSATSRNFTLFGDLLARMALADGTSKGFHRPLMLSVGQAQYSEEQLSTHWNMGRKHIRRLLDGLERLELIDTCRSRVASVMTFPCLLQWMAKDGSVVSNPFIHKQRERIEPF